MGWEATREWVSEEQARLRHRIVPSSVASYLFEDPPEAGGFECVREDASEAFEETVVDAAADVDAVCESTTPATGLEPFPGGVPERLSVVRGHRETLEERTEALSAAIEESVAAHDVQTLPSHDELRDVFLTEAERDELRRLEDRLATTIAHLEATTTVARELPRYEAQYERIDGDLGELATYARYLPGTERTHLEGTLEALDAGLADLKSSVDVARLAPSHRQRIESLSSKVEYGRVLVPDYNEGGDDTPLEGFVAYECRTQSELFTDIDEDGNDLNPQQRRAVVRNDASNQVIAAAGTGKTVVLTFRVAYLVREQGVDPADIACLTYTTQAKLEMATRLEEWFGITAVDVKTIHAFSLHIATDSLDGAVEVPDDEDRMTFVRETIRDETDKDESEFKHHYKQFLFHSNDTRVREEEYASKKAYFQARQNEQYTTFQGETAQSYAEKVIADFLFRHQVTYEHERRAEWAETADDKGGYQPDFYLPEYDLYIEHWGIDENATVPAWFTWDTETYLDKMKWARGQYDDPENPELVDTYEFEHQANRLEQVLEHRLRANGVRLSELSYKELVRSVFDYNKRKGKIHQNLSSFVTNAKVFDVDSDDILTNVDSDDPRQYHFAQCGRILLQRYDEWLERTGQIPFSDMVTRADRAIRENPTTYRNRYDHVMVDEFQDVSGSQITLLKRLVGDGAGPRLFAVGDDWQSIYSFQGSQVEYFVDFDEHFPSVRETFLTKNYRCPESVLDAGDDLIANNDRQIEKTVSAESSTETTPTVHVLDGRTDSEYTTNVVEHAANRIEEYLGAWPNGDGDDAETTHPRDVMVLCHYDSGAPYMDGLKNELRERDVPYDGKDDFYRPESMPGKYSSEFDDEAGVATFSIHQAKGREAEHVILLHACSDELGIPNDRSERLLQPVKPIDTNSEPEDRRLFYVGLTRAEGTLDVLTRSDARSKFVDEIEQHCRVEHSLGALETCSSDRVNVTARVESIEPEISDKKHQEGTLTGFSGERTQFVVWAANDPSEDRPTLEDGRWYRICDATLSAYNGTVELELNEATTVTSIPTPAPATRDDRDKVKIVRKFDDPHEKKFQDGYLRTSDGDERRVHSWQSRNDEPDPPSFQEGTWYLLGDYGRTEFNGELQYVINPETELTETEPPSEDVEVTTVYEDVGEKFKQKGKLEIGGHELAFVIWADSDVGTLTESNRYSLTDFEYNKFGGTREIVVTAETEVVRLH